MSGRIRGWGRFFKHWNNGGHRGLGRDTWNIRTEETEKGEESESLVDENKFWKARKRFNTEKNRGIWRHGRVKCNILLLQ